VGARRRHGDLHRVGGADWLQGYVINVIMVRTMWRLREAVEAKINRLPLSYFDRVQRGELISRVTNDIDNITQTMQQSLSTAVTNILTVVGVLVMMFSISWQLAIVALIALPLMAVVFGIIGPKSQKAFTAQWRKVGRLNARVEESFSGHALVRVFGRGGLAREVPGRERGALPGRVQGPVPLRPHDARHDVHRLAQLRRHRGARGPHGRVGSAAPR
jgi:ABC-type multidrug transport system fused ATPase/permease subunit